jgi:catechol 2,3-dioxygenase-like lactoylglutathione lyase family enzyme
MTSAPTFDHVGISVADLEAAAGWYCAALGLTREFAFEVPPVSLRGVMLLSDAGYRVELLERAGSAPAGPAPGGPDEAALRRGYGHICLDVPDVDAAHAALLTAGAADRMPPRASPEPGIRMAFVADPEGNLIELIDRSAARARAR